VIEAKDLYVQSGQGSSVQEEVKDLSESFMYRNMLMFAMHML
jgi:hypothetical protein